MRHDKQQADAGAGVTATPLGAAFVHNEEHNITAGSWISSDVVFRNWQVNQKKKLTRPCCWSHALNADHTSDLHSITSLGTRPELIIGVCEDSLNAASAVTRKHIAP